MSPTPSRTALWTDRSLVKTWSMRGTLHLLPAADFGMWPGGAFVRVYERFLRSLLWSRRLGVKPAELEEIVAAVAAVLSGGALLRQGAHGRSSLDHTGGAPR